MYGTTSFFDVSSRINVVTTISTMSSFWLNTTVPCIVMITITIITTPCDINTKTSLKYLQFYSRFPMLHKSMSTKFSSTRKSKKSEKVVLL